MSSNISTRSIIFSTPIMIFFSFLIFLDFSYPRLFTFEKMMWGIFTLTLSITCLNHKRLNEIPKPLIFLIIFFIFQCINGIVSQASFRNFAGAFTLYLLPLSFTIYLNINQKFLELLINNIDKLVPFFLICILFGVFINFVFLGGYRYEVFNPFVYIFFSMLLIRNFNIKSILFFIFIILLILFSNVRAPLFFLFLILFLCFQHIRKGAGSSRFFDILFLSIIALIVLFSYQFLLEFGRYATLGNIQSLFLWEDLYYSGEFSLLTRIFEIQSILVQMESANYFTLFFGNGIGSAFTPSTDLLYLTGLAGGDYSDLMRSGSIHNIHVGIFASFFRLGLIGLIFHFLLIIMIFRAFLNSKDKEFWIHLTSLLYLLNDLLYTSLQSSVFVLSISMSACIILNKNLKAKPNLEYYQS